MPAGRPPIYETPEQMQRIIDLYFAACKINQLIKITDQDKEDLISGYSEEDKEVIDYIDDFAPTVSGLAYILNMTTETLRVYGTNNEFSATVKRAKQRIEKFLEGNLYGQAVTGTIFNLKNNFGWKDKTETEHSGVLGLTDLTDEQLDARLAALAESQTES